jgi:ribosomal protein L32
MPKCKRCGVPIRSGKLCEECIEGEKGTNYDNRKPR